MPIEVKLPPLGENIPGGDVVDVNVKVGDVVKLEQALFDVEAEKSVVSVPAPAAGRIAKLLVKKGDRVETDQVVAVIEDGDGKAAAPAAPVPSEAKATAKPTSPSPEKEVKEPAGQDSAPDRPAGQAPAPVQKSGQERSPVIRPASDVVVHAGPATRRVAREWGVDLTRVPGSGPKGRITQDDVKEHVRNLASGGGSAGRGIEVPPLPDFARWGPVDIKPLESIRKRTAEHVRLAWSLIPHVTHHDLADITELEAFRKQQDAQGPKLTVTAFALKALPIVLKQWPQFNASLDDAAGQIIHMHYYHVGVAVDTDKGLVVPVLRDVDKKSVQDIAKEMAEVAERARTGKLKPDDMQGGTFTVSNLGGIGGVAFSPIVNWPQVAILGLSRSRLQPVWKDGQWVPRLQLPLSLSYDHRVIDGAAAARFCRALAEMLENPMKMLLHA